MMRAHGRADLDRQDASTLPLLLDATKASAALSISPRTLWELTHNGSLPAVRIGRRVLYSPDQLQEWIASQGREEVSP